MKLKTAPLRVIKRADLAVGQFAGIASSMSTSPDRQGDRILPGAFAATIAAWAARGSGPPILWNHDIDKVIGVVLSMVETDQGLEVTGQLLDGNEQASEARELMKLGALYLSIGGEAPPGGALYADDGSIVFQAIDLLEITITPVPADAGAVILASKSMRTQREVQAMLRQQAGFSKRQAERLLKSGWSGLNLDDDDDDEPREAELADIAARISDLNHQLGS